MKWAVLLTTCVRSGKPNDKKMNITFVLFVTG